MKHYFGLESDFELSFLGPVHLLLIAITILSHLPIHYCYITGFLFQYMLLKEKRIGLICYTMQYSSVQLQLLYFKIQP